MKAIRKISSTSVDGTICVHSGSFVELINAAATANRVLKLKTIMMTFIILSSKEYLPTSKRRKQMDNIITDHISILTSEPNRVEAIPAVTIVTAVCMVNMVAMVNKA